MLWDDELEKTYIEERCPECDVLRVYVYLTCHTYGGNPDGTGWWHCIDCSSAGEIHCTNCDWSYTWGLNPRNPRSETNELSRPNWLVGDWPW